MGAHSHYIASSETEMQISVSLKKPTRRYADEFFRLNRIASDMLELGIYPDFKEWTESSSCYHAARKWTREFNLRDSDVTVVCVGDGATPRTAAMFAFRSAWQCIAVDPGLKPHEKWNKIERLTVTRAKIQHCDYSDLRRVVVVGCHSHATVEETLAPFSHSASLAFIALPCCVRLDLPWTPDVEQDDWGCWSPCRTVKVWRDVFGREEGRAYGRG